MRFVVWIWVAALLWRKGEFDLCAKLKREMEMDGGDGDARVGYTRMRNVSREGRNRWVRLRTFLKENVDVMCL